MRTSDLSAARGPLPTPAGTVQMFRLGWLADAGLADAARLPHTVKILLEGVLRMAAAGRLGSDAVLALARWPDADPGEVPFVPARVLMQDFTGVPAVVDLAAMRSAFSRAGADPSMVETVIPVDLVIDHSVQVDRFGTAGSYRANLDHEYRRNAERYAFLRWAQGAFGGFRVVPPGRGICHQVNLEHLSRVVQVRDGVAFPDTVLGTDSHTTMVNGLGVLGWGVGGIEAEAAMLGQALMLPWPRVVGVRLDGALAPGVTATDLVLTLTEVLRRHGVVGKYVEFFGPVVSSLGVPDRATMANMAPEYGATAALFPVDDQTLRYLRETGRGRDAEVAERYAKEQGLFRTGRDDPPAFDEVVELDLSAVEPSLAGPRRPQDRVALPAVPRSFREAFPGRPPAAGEGLGDGSVVIAAITSCTNTSNPAVMVAAGLLARNAVRAGLRTPRWVKTSLAPGSRVVTDYLDRAGLTPFLEQLGFHLVGYGCTTCIGNSGPLEPWVARAIEGGDLAVAAVLSGNRNFEGRIHPLVRAAYLASPPLCVAYALAGRVDLDLTHDPVGFAPDGRPVLLGDLWPVADEVRVAIAESVAPGQFEREYAEVFVGDRRWGELPAPAGAVFDWDPRSTYVREPPFFEGIGRTAEAPADVEGARALVVLGDSVTTDHISPAGSIAPRSDAAVYLVDGGVEPGDFNSYGSRRGNHEVMVRGTFGNVRLRNLLVPGVEGPVTVHLPDGERMSIYEAASRYREEGVPLLVLAGREYGSGSSRDWAAKGTRLLGVQAVLAESFERIHRSNLVGMGVLPLQFLPGDSVASLGLTGRETFAVRGLAAGPSPGGRATVAVGRGDGTGLEFLVLVRLDGPTEVEHYREGGVLPMVARGMLGGP